MSKHEWTLVDKVSLGKYRDITAPNKAYPPLQTNSHHYLLLSLFVLFVCCEKVYLSLCVKIDGCSKFRKKRIKIISMNSSF